MIIDFIIEKNTCKTTFSSLKCEEANGFKHYFSGKKPKRFKKLLDFIKHNNGVTLVENENGYFLYNDPFKTIPLYISKTKNGRVHVSSDFRSAERNIIIEKELDQVGLWENILFGSSLSTRTIYKNVLQLPSASYVCIYKKNNDFRIEKYWDYLINEDESLSSIKKSAELLFERLDEEFSCFKDPSRYVLGLSGGLDSRLALSFLSRHLERERLELFTYGYDERILEYFYSSQVANRFGYQKPLFHQLTDQSYVRALSDLPMESGGQIGIQHCHIFDFLNLSRFREKPDINQLQ